MGVSASDGAWEEIRRLYCESDEGIKSIARQCGLSESAIRKRAAAEGWARPTARNGPKKGPPKPRVGGSAKAARGALEKRLYLVMVRKLEKLERRMACDESMSAADDEREMREIANMIRGFEKVKTAGADAKSTSACVNALGTDGLAERKREEIARRLERLHQRWLAKDDPE